MEKDNAKEEIEVLDNFDINKKEEPIKEEKIEKKQKKEKKPREKRKMKKGEKIFFIINFLLLLGIVGFYAYRTVYYYKISHEVNEEITLRDKIIGFDNVVYQNDGLYEKDEVYYFKGTDVNNYLYFSGNMYRIIEINKGIKAILDDTVTNLVWGIEGNYEESIIYSWLSDTYINSLKDYEAYLQKNNWCNESIDVEKYNCKETISDFVGLLSTEEYLRAGGKNSYLNNGTYFWTINQDSDGKALYVNIDGSINNLNYKDENYYSYGIRGVITFREDLLLTSGEGTKNDPYIIEDNSGVLVRDKAVGSYVKYNDETFRVLSVDEDGVSLILDGIIEEEKKNWDILGYLNNDYLSKFDTEELVKIDYGSGEYRYENKYSLGRDKKDSYYVVIPSIGDMYLNDYSNYWLSNAQDFGLGLFYILDENKMYFADLNYNSHYIRPIIKVKSDLIINDGNGMKNSPFVIGEDNVEED